MAKPKLIGKALAPLRWTVEAAAREFGVDRKTLAKRLTQEGAIPAQDGRFGTKQILEALYGGKDQEEILLLRAKRQMVEDKRDELRGRLLDAEAVESAWSGVVGGVVQRLESIPTKVESRYRPGMTGVELRGLIEQEIDQTRREMVKDPTYRRKKRKGKQDEN